MSLTNTRDIRRFFQAGMIAKGTVYCIMGGLALAAAFGSGGQQDAGKTGALQFLEDQPYGNVLLILLGLGLLAYCVWRWYRAIADPEQEGSDKEGLAKRTGYAVSGTSYGLLGIFAIISGIRYASASSGGDSKQSFIAELLSQPFGQWLVGFIGVIVFFVGIYEFYRGYTGKHMEELQNHQLTFTERKWYDRLGTIGLYARAVVFCIIAYFLLLTAVEANAGQVIGIGGAFEFLRNQGPGIWLLVIVALGMVAYGIFQFVRARYQRIV